jgi:hypothetical protein
MTVKIFIHIALTREQNWLIFGVALLGCVLDSHRILVLLPAKK